MRKIIILLAIIITPFFIQRDQRDLQKIVIESKTYNLLVADSPLEHSKGLMSVKELKNADGMLFLFEDSQVRTFWNQNTLLDLDVYWMQDDNVVGKSFLPSINQTKAPIIVGSKVPVNKVVEIIRN